jgi:flavodoxin I
MKRIGVFFSFHSNKTSKIGHKIIEAFGEDMAEPVNVEEITEEQFNKYENIIVGVPTWFDGELPNYWDEFLPALEDMDLSGKKIALYGLGDQVGYPENFNDGIGILSNVFASQGAEIVGYTSATGYTFEKSKALKGDKFCGLCLDQENQARLTSKRIEDWIVQLKNEFI